ncbi:MAG: prenyltransferase/squalene oxidase repeat-containing protein [Bryobacteraceae bacterium]
MSPSLQVDGALLSAAAQAGERAAKRLASLQDPAGYWSFEVSAGAPLEAEFILLELWLHPPEAGVWNPPNAERVQRAAAAILARQLPDGGFGVYPGGPAEASATVMAYFALKLTGIPVNDARLQRARARALALGGIERANSRAKIDLSWFGLYPRKDCPAVAPETVLLRGRARGLSVPLGIIHSFNPVRPVPAGFTLQELFPRQGGAIGWTGLAWLLKQYERRPLGWLRNMAVAKCRRRMLERLRDSEELGATFHYLLYSILALDLLGYPPDHPDRAAAQAQLERLIEDRDGQFRVRPCLPTVWDAAIAARALGEWGLAPEAPTQAGAVERWLARQARDGGWAALDAEGDATCPAVTGRVLEAIAAAPGVGGGHPAVRRAVEYLLKHQEPDGSWRGGVSYIHGTFLALRGLCAAGVDNHEATVLRGGEWLRSIQNADGGWGESWASCAQGEFSAALSTASQTAWALLGLMAGGDWESLSVRQGIECLVRTQQEDGGWQEGLAYPLEALGEYRKAVHGGKA